MINIAIDAMSGDHGLASTIPAALLVAAENPEVQCLLVGDEVQIRAALEKENPSSQIMSRIDVVPASQVVEMDEKPAIALRKKKDSSMRVAINLVKDNRAAACVSAGNTGALMATGRFVLKMIPGIDRPAIASDLPRKDGWVTMLDLGANIDTPAENLLQFGLMGSALASCVHGKSRPTVGLLNVGAEDVKGSQLIQDASGLLKQSKLNYVGFVEGDDIFGGDVDVVVCDGFVGNVALKTSEGLAQMIIGILKQEFTQNIFTKLMGLIGKPVLKAIASRVDSRKFNGASLIGLNGIVVKSHGSMDSIGFASAIKVAIKEAEEGIIESIKTRL